MPGVRQLHAEAAAQEAVTIPIVNGHTALATLKTELRLGDTTDDTRLERVIEAVSRLIDRYCRRHFYKTSPNITRYFTADDARKLYIDDLETYVSLATDADGDFTFETSWTRDTDFALGPYNAATLSPARPFTVAEVMASSGQRFPIGVPRGVKIVGTWGWAVVPDEVEEACLLQSARVFRRGDAPFGVAPLATLDGGGIQLRARLDPDVELMLRGLVHHPVVVG